MKDKIKALAEELATTRSKEKIEAKLWNFAFICIKDSNKKLIFKLSNHIIK